ncbi:hypothetical protein [Streptomyces virginiae]|uniref:hypothetical protein n=1 Tax=Streptomyces virginiae TaxID=1961 RepID=UPI0022535B5D|nr:hypothetical protein [Streptomyces virginiae]MCX5270041.1 hypothetical protein [Streptomyces virginiae]
MDAAVALIQRARYTHSHKLPDHVAIRLAMVEDGAQHMTAELRELAPSLKTRRPSTPVQAVRLPPIPSATSGPTRH